ncbi:MAG: PhoPQ-activated protein PqaA family protein [Pirellulales bacterium]
MFKQTILVAVVLTLLLCEPPRFTRVAAAEVKAAAAQGPLADYVAKEDKSYKWTKRREGKLGSGDYVELTLTSQTWKDVVWKHQLFIYKPAKIAIEKQALFWIDGGRWNDDLEKPAAADADLGTRTRLLASLADQLQTPVALLLHVPQQPMFDGMVEDEIISLTFAKYFLTGDAEWPLLLPMVKSAVRGMDAVQEFTRQEWQLDINSFTMTGASKRGWTTWLTSAIDPRVAALAPMVIDMLNMTPQMKHQLESFGGYSEQIADYTSKGLQNFLDTERGQQLAGIVDPFSYRAHLSQPKLIILATNDRYWPLDALNLYWNQLDGEKYVLYVPNNGHGIRDIPRLVGALNAFHQHVANGNKLPKLEWKFTEEDAKLRLRVKSDVAPKQVQIWTANSDTRDFRNSQFAAKPMQADGPDYVYELAVPDSGYAALLGEAVFNGQRIPFNLSTNVRIVGHGKKK